MAPLHRPALKLLSISDIEDKTLIQGVENKSFPPVDLILSCGDLPPEYLAFLRDRLDAPLFYIKGNHDIRYSSANPLGCHNIHGKLITFKGRHILGLEGSAWYNGGENQYTEREMKKFIRRLWFPLWRKKPLHLVITHAPPRHIHDREDPCHQGFHCFNTLIQRHRPEFFIHGHIHQSFDAPEDRETRVGNTRIINTCGSMLLEI